jgi:peptidyl-prolyl cis-trans isomerase D
MKNKIIVFLIFVCFILIAAKKEDPLLRETVKQMKALAKQYELCKPSEDSLFAINHSSNSWFDKDLFCEGTFLKGTEDKFNKAEERDVVGPFVIGNRVEIYKILERRELPDSCEARIIWIAHKGGERTDPGIKRTKPQSLLRADSIRSLIVSGKFKMEDIVSKYTDDPGSFLNNGNYGWFTAESGFIPEMKYAGLTLPVGTTAIFDSVFGYYVIQVLAQSATHHPYTIVGVIKREIKQQ